MQTTGPPNPNPLIIVTTGCSSGLGLAAVVDLINSGPPPAPFTGYLVILGIRQQLAQSAFQQIHEARQANPRAYFEQIKLDLADLASVKAFAGHVGDKVATYQGAKVDRLLLNAAAFGLEGNGVSGWTKEAQVNHFAQHYLLSLLLPLIQQPSPYQLTPRVVFTSSSLQNSIKTAPEAKPLLRHPATGNTHDRYAASKFVQACAAFGWQERLGDGVEVVLVSPGFVPTSGLNRASSLWTRIFLHYILSWAPFCTSLKAGGAAIARALLLTSADLGAIPPASSADHPSEVSAAIDATDASSTKTVAASSSWSVRYLGPDGKPREVNPVVLEGGKDLWHEWMPSQDEVEGWLV